MIENMKKNAEEASDFLKSISHPGRLMILCHLVEGEKHVTELIKLTGMLQTTMSQNLSKLRAANLIDFRRDHRILYYSIQDPKVLKILSALKEIYC